MRFEVSRLVRRGLLVLSLAAPAVATPALATDLNWPQFRGPEGQGVTHETGIALEWSDTKNVLWKTELPGRGHSSPIIWGKKICVDPPRCRGSLLLRLRWQARLENIAGQVRQDGDG